MNLGKHLSKFVLVAILIPSVCFANPAPYLIGTGIHDITGPPAEVMFAGYCDFDQIGEGILMRQRSRAFIIRDAQNNSVVLVTTDMPMMATGVYVAVINKLKETYGNLYTEKNVVLSATHTHSGPGGYFKTYALNVFAGMTYHEGNFNKIVNGIYASIVSAHNSLTPGNIYFTSDKFSANRGERVNYNRSPEAYNNNRDKNDYQLADGRLDNTNRRLTQLKLVKANGEVLGIYNWTPIHPNVSGNKKRLINGDVDGLAAYMLEKEYGTHYLDNNPFVAAFTQNDCADTSGNLPEDWERLHNTSVTHQFDDPDDDDGEPCQRGNICVTKDIYRTDGKHDYQRMQWRADTVSALAETLLNESGEALTGNIEIRQIFVPLPHFAIDPAFIAPEDLYYRDVLDETRNNCQLCSGAAGLSFFAGSVEDGDSGLVACEAKARDDVTDHSIEDLSQIFTDPLSGILSILLPTLTESDDLYAEMDCQREKKIGLSLDELNTIVPDGKAWNLNFPVQIIKIDHFAILTLPFEVTTMSGRRLKAEVKEVLSDVDHVVINATSNSDGRYLTTREEYASQQYEGGANLLGPFTLNAIRQIVHQLAETFDPANPTPDYAVGFEVVENALETDSVFQVSGNVIFDDKPLWKSFGDVIEQPHSVYEKGQFAQAVFWGAHPNNNLTVGSEESYLKIEKKCTPGECSGSDSWRTVAYDWDPTTKYIWKRDGIANSRITIKWHIPEDTPSGEYRIRHIGQWKSGWTGQIKRYEGHSRNFWVN